MHSTFRQLRLFLALADERSVSRAAHACHVTQPTASMQLKELALGIGLPLYEVIGKQVHLTEAGKELAKTARAMLGEWQSFSQYVDGINGLERGQLRVAVVSTAKYFVPRMLGEFCIHHPEIDIALEVLNRDGVVTLLRENRVDLTVMSIPPSDLDVVREDFLANPLVAIAPVNHALTAEASIPVEELAKNNLILREAGSGTRMAIDRFFDQSRIKPRVRLELGSNEAIKQAVAGGLGLSILSRHALSPDPSTEGLAILEIIGFPILSNWYIVHLTGKRLSPIATVFKNHLQATAARLNPTT